MTCSQYIIFLLDQQEYCFNISCVQEIVRIPQIWSIPDTPGFIEGIINLRGKVIPVIDLKKRFDFKACEKSDNARLLILNLEKSLTGIIVDDVLEVLEIDGQCIDSFFSQSILLSGNCVSGIAKIDNRLVIALDEKVFEVEVFDNITE